MRIDDLQRGAKIRLAVAGAFLFFVLYSAPHRVHHLFEKLGVPQETSDDAATPTPSHTHPGQNSGHDDAGHEHDQSPGGSTKADCVGQAVAQNSHVAPAEAAEVDCLEVASKTQPIVTLSWHYHFSPSPFSQRAPPRG